MITLLNPLKAMMKKKMKLMILPQPLAQKMKTTKLLTT
jgi:hypothetical protein